MGLMENRFHILKSKAFPGLYCILDTQQQEVIATCDSAQEAKSLIEEITLLVNREAILDEAMEKLGIQ